MPGTSRPAANIKAMLHKTKKIELNTHDLDTLTVLLRRELNNIIKSLKTAPLDQDTSEGEALADHLFDLVKRLEAASEDITREIFQGSPDHAGVDQQTPNQ